MGFNYFRIKLLARILLLSANIFVFIYLLVKTNLILTAGVLAVLVLIQIWALFHYVDKTNRLLNSFLQSIRYSDFSRTFQVENDESSLERLKLTLNDVISDFKAVREEKEESYYYLQTVIQHIGIALIAYQKDGSVEFINSATKRMFQLRNLNNIQMLQDYSPELVNKLLTIRNGENVLVKVRDNDGFLQLSIYGTGFKIHNRDITLVSIKNIQSELDEQEMESWQKLIRVLTHEIMNSITPISSLSSTITHLMKDVIQKLEGKNSCKEEQNNLLEILEALSTIDKRTEGLIYFVNTYRNLTSIPTPEFSIFPVEKLLKNIYRLHQNDFEKKNIHCQIVVEPPTLELSADEKLIEQVLINLLRNSIYAFEKNEGNNILLSAYLNRRGKIAIQVVDNGRGILPEVLDKIFIPFFSTKQNGSGIGLSLSRQIMRLHAGSISAFSVPGRETKFTLMF